MNCGVLYVVFANYRKMKQERFFENFMLGVTQGEIPVDDRAMNIAAVHKLANSAILSLNVLSRNLDHQIYDRSDIIEAFSKLARRNRNSSIRILIYDCTKVIKYGHRLANLADRAPSKITIRKLPAEFTLCNESMIVADGKGYLHNPQSDRYEGNVSFNDTSRCGELNKLFTDLWNQSEIEPDLRRVPV